MSMSAVAENPAAAQTAQPAQQTATQQHVQQQAQQAQQSHQVAAQAAAQPAQPPTPGDSDSLVCQWANCGERQSSAENLYNHVCDRHVGRKSTNNLNLVCQWGSCRTQTMKRDHITSHVRVHVPLKPHKCPTCNKAFKRPQDLKKHVKTHADDSVLLRSPEPSRGHPHGGPGGGFAAGVGKNVADLQALAGAASGFYQDGMGGTSYGHPNAGAGGGFYSGAPANSAYGPVYYAVNPQQQMTNDYEVRKRAVDALNALNEFFGSVKRREIDPTTYYDVGHRLMGIQGQIPLLTSMAGYGGSDFQSQPAMVSPTGHGPAPSHHYSLPIPNLRTKSDLVEIDQVLEQLQNTVYENPKQAAAAGVGQPGAHYIHSGFNYRSSNSPPGTHGVQPQSAHATTLAPLSTSQTETPALTPASSVVSYTSGQSPSSVHSGHTVSPAIRNNNISMYPTLPSVSAMSDIAGSYPATSNAPNLAPFDSDSRRRWSGNQLQKARPARDSEAMDISDNDSTPNASRRNSADRDSLRKDVTKLTIQSPTPVDPSLRSPGEQSEDSEHHSSDTADGDENWVQNIRMIEELRAFIKAKLEGGEYEDGEGEASLPPSKLKEEQPTEDKATSSAMSEDERSLYPVLRAVQED